MRRIYSPILLGNVENDRARAFVFIFTCDAFARAILISLVPLQAYALLGAAWLVSVAYFGSEVSACSSSRLFGALLDHPASTGKYRWLAVYKLIISS